ncbi:Valacyclovir hydrolase [Folsomia candida]|uniref:Valacyclovir hydrolase n=1 Tax=Folsomia candida TaxID=158441 RepID=A0A226EJC5_FOLCA|nr:Valacyclovir hydrolase [Folsomia candida]
MIPNLWSHIVFKTIRITPLALKNKLSKSIISKNLSCLNYSTKIAPPKIIYQKIRVFDCDMNYVEMEGNPDHVVFILPGALSSIEQDFVPLLQNFDSKKYKVIAYDPPGYGGSRPPNRWDIKGIKLGHQKYSLAGWSMGAFTAAIMALKNPEQTRKLVVWGMGGYFDEVTSNNLKTMASIGISCLPKARLSQLLNIYGEEDLKKIFYKWVSQEADESVAVDFTKDGLFTKQCLNQLRIPTLIIQGAKDGFVHVDHMEYLHRNINGSKTHLIKNGSHATHCAPSEKEFLTVVDKFLSS